MGIDNLFTMQVDDETLNILEQIRMLRKQEKQIKTSIGNLRELLLDRIGDHEELIDGDGCPIASYRMSKPVQKFNKDLFKAQHPKLYDQYMYEDIGVRTLRFDKTWEAE